MSHRGQQSAASAMTNGVGASTGAGSAGPTTAKVSASAHASPARSHTARIHVRPCPSRRRCPSRAGAATSSWATTFTLFSLALCGLAAWTAADGHSARVYEPHSRPTRPETEDRSPGGGAWPFEGSSQFEWCFAPADCASPPTRRECLISPRQRARNSAKNAPLPSRRRRARPLLDVWQ